MSRPATSAPGDFVPADLDASRWENIQPLYRSLADRELKCAGCLEQLLLDRSNLDAAARELLGSDKPIKAIAREWGFADTGHMHRSFRKYFNCTPVEYLSGQSPARAR